MDVSLDQALAAALAGDGAFVVVTGAGVSAESGIPTFRGQDGYWTVGSRVYHPQELATHAAFRRMPEEVWRWYLYRLGVCRAAEPNPAHVALVELERALGDRFRLVTQNVDGLHLRAGSSSTSVAAGAGWFAATATKWPGRCIARSAYSRPGHTAGRHPSGAS